MEIIQSLFNAVVIIALWLFVVMVRRLEDDVEHLNAKIEQMECERFENEVNYRHGVD